MNKETPLILVEGSYIYYESGQQYSQEEFKFAQLPESQIYFLHSEIISRIETGEFLKIIVRHELNSHFYPQFVRIEKFLGPHYSLETIKIDAHQHQLQYSFKNHEGEQNFTKTANAKQYLTSPAFASSCFFSLTKKFEATGRTAINLVGTTSEWTYQGPPEESIIYSEIQNRETTTFIHHNSTYPATRLTMYESDLSQNSETPIDFILSKHFAIPYSMEFGTQKIEIKNLKKNF
jgi:hypothetical protein